MSNNATQQQLKTPNKYFHILQKLKNKKIPLPVKETTV